MQQNICQSVHNSNYQAQCREANVTQGFKLGSELANLYSEPAQ